MSLICDYFLATDDNEAAATIDWDGGPGQPSAASGHKPLPTCPFPGIEPVVMMGMLEHLLTGNDVKPIVAANASDMIAARDGGERLVVRMSAALVEGLTTTPDERLTVIAEPWSEIEELWGTGNPADLAEGLHRLAALVRGRDDAGRALYCWVCV